MFKDKFRRWCVIKILKKIGLTATIMSTLAMTGCSFSIGDNEYSIWIPFLETNSNSVSPFLSDYNLKDVSESEIREVADLDLDGPNNSGVSSPGSNENTDSSGSTSDPVSGDSNVGTNKEIVIVLDPVGSYKGLEISAESVKEYFTVKNVLPAVGYKTKDQTKSSRKDYFFRYPCYTAESTYKFTSTAEDSGIESAVKAIKIGNLYDVKIDSDKKFKAYVKWTLDDNGNSVAERLVSSGVTLDNNAFTDSKKAFRKYLTEHVMTGSDGSYINATSCTEKMMKYAEFCSLIGVPSYDVPEYVGKNLARLVEKANGVCFNKRVGCKYGDLYETDVVYNYAEILEAALEKEGYKVIFTRKDIKELDETAATLKTRVKDINKRAQSSDVVLISIESPYYCSATTQPDVSIKYAATYGDETVEKLDAIAKAVYQDFQVRTCGGALVTDNNYLLNHVTGTKYAVSLCLGDIREVGEVINKTHSDGKDSTYDFKIVEKTVAAIKNLVPLGTE